MLAIEVEFLTGRAYSSRRNDRRTTEWPPHPGRLFSAMVAACHECDLGEDAEKALNWLEAQPPPEIYADPPTDEYQRDAPPVFVPTNDYRGDKDPEKFFRDRLRNDRTFKNILVLLEQILQQCRDKEKLSTSTPKLIQQALDILESHRNIYSQKEKRELKESLKTILTFLKLEESTDIEIKISVLADIRKKKDMLNDKLKARRNEVFHLFPEQRSRQERYFPSLTPRDPVVRFLWPEAYPDKKIKRAIGVVSENITYLGHSTSLVRAAITDNSPPANLKPNQEGRLLLRVPGPGRLAHLEAVHQAKLENSFIQPRLGKLAKYAPATNKTKSPQSLFVHQYRFRHIFGPCLPLECFPKLLQVVRKRLMSLWPDPVPEIISGHREDRTPTKQPHLSLVPLGDVGHRYAKEHIMGFTLWMPKHASVEVLMELEETLAELVSAPLKLGKYGVWKIASLDPASDIQAPIALQPELYNASSREWVTVTPAIFGKFPKKSQIGPGKNGGKILAELCSMIGLPAPEEVQMSQTSSLTGTSQASAFPVPDWAQDRLRSHVYLRFAEPVLGPVLLGAGRHAGYGLCRPCKRKVES